MDKKKNIKSKRKTTKQKSDINVPNTISTLKVKIILIITLLIMIALIGRIAYIQFFNGEHSGEQLQLQATSQQTLTETINAKRGTIYDSTGQVLAISYNSDKIYFNPKEIDSNNTEAIAQSLSTILDLNYEELLEKMKSATSRILVASDVEQEKAVELQNWKNNFKETGISYSSDTFYLNPSKMYMSNKELIANGLASVLNVNYNELLSKIDYNNEKFIVASDVESERISKFKSWHDKFRETGVSIEESTSRSYPFKSLASTVIGFVNADNQGSYGIEESWNSFLSGTAGKSVSLKDATQSEIANSEKTYIAAENGYDLTLTIDVYIQTIVEKYLAEAVEEYKCESGITIAMDPSTGKILAMADYPNYDCNDHNTPNSSLAKTWDSLSSEEKTNALFEMWRPKAIADTYEPGSVFKIITSAIALEENITDTDIAKTFTCTGSYTVEGEPRPIRCHKYPASHGDETLRTALENSCNPAFIELGLRIGKDTSYKYYEAFGFFEKTGISISGEPKSGIFYPLDKIKPHELGTMSFGQRFTITPLQMITAASAIANDGVLVQPQIVEKMTNTDTGEVTTFKTQEVRQVVSKETADKVASMMESVVEDGTGKKVKYDDSIKVRMSGYSVGGKTGTSEPINGSTDGYIASFLAISPVENTKIVLLVILDTPGEGVNHNGGQIAAPTAGKMLAEILPHMGIESGNKDNNTNSNISEKDLY